MGRTSRSDVLLYLGRSYHALRDFSRAVRVLDAYVRLKPQSIRGHFFLGRSYVAAGHYEKAVPHLRACQSTSPHAGATHGLLGVAFLRSKRPELAAECFQKAREIEPDNPRFLNGYLNALLVLGVKLFYRGENKDSAKAFHEVLQHKPDSLVPHIYLAAVSRELGDSRTALQHLNRIAPQVADDPFLHLSKAAALLDQGKHDQALTELNHSVSLAAIETPAAVDATGILRMITVVLFRQRRYRKTVYYAKKALRADAGLAEMHVILAESFRNLGNPQKARNHFLRAIEKDRHKLEPHYGLALVLWEMGAHRSLADELKKILRANPGDNVAKYYTALCLPKLGRSPTTTIGLLQDQIRMKGPDPTLMHALGSEYVRAKMPELAEGWFLKTLRLVADHKDSLRALPRVYLDLGKQREQEQYLRKYLECYPDDRDQRKVFVDLLLDTQDYGAAASEIETLVAFDAQDVVLRKRLAVCYVKDRRYQAALVVLRDLLRQEPRSLRLLIAYCSCLGKCGSPDKAVRILERVWQRNRDNPAILLRLGVLYRQVGNLERAASVFRKVILVSPSDWRGYHNLGKLYQEMGNPSFAQKFLARAQECRQSAE